MFVFIGGLGLLAALVPVGHGFVTKGGGWFTPAVFGGAFTLHPLLVAVPWAACFVLGLLDWRRPWRVEHLHLLALAGFFPVAMLLSDDLPAAGLWLAAGCLGWLFVRLAGACHGMLRLHTVAIYAVRFGYLASWPITGLGAQMAGRPVDLARLRGDFARVLRGPLPAYLAQRRPPGPAR